MIMIVAVFCGSLLQAQPTKEKSPAGGSPVGVKRHAVEALALIAEATIQVGYFLRCHKGSVYVVQVQYNPESGEKCMTVLPVPLLLQDEIKEEVGERELYKNSSLNERALILDNEFASSWWSLCPEWVLDRLGWGPGADCWS